MTRVVTPMVVQLATTFVCLLPPVRETRASIFQAYLGPSETPSFSWFLTYVPWNFVGLWLFLCKGQSHVKMCHWGWHLLAVSCSIKVTGADTQHSDVRNKIHMQWLTETSALIPSFNKYFILQINFEVFYYPALCSVDFESKLSALCGNVLHCRGGDLATHSRIRWSGNVYHWEKIMRTPWTA